MTQLATRSPNPCDFIVVGGTGNLALRRILPALYNLHRDRQIARENRILGVARNASSREHYHVRVKECLSEVLPVEAADDESWRSFAERLHYVEMSATDPSSYGPLAGLLNEDPDRVRVFYLAVAPALFGPISEAIAIAGLVSPHSRIVLEKPIGLDLASATAINQSVGSRFQERQIYRIDHDLGQEMVQNVLALRFGNAIFEHMWRAERIDHVQITVAETHGLKGRSAYYDSAGALRDTVQNHLLQLLCLIAMEPPAELSQNAIREEKIRILKAIRPITGGDVFRNVVRGQYRSGAIEGRPVHGYLDEDTIPEDSRTETFVALKTEIETWRWAGVPFYLRTGLRMSHRVSEVVIQFKRVPHVLFKDQAGIMQDDRLVIRLKPDERVSLGLMVKIPGSGLSLRPMKVNLALADSTGHRTPSGYEHLLLDVVRGDATFFMHREEVEAAWRWVDPILAAWEERRDRPRSYAAGTWGPTESIALMVRDDRQWYENLVL